MGNMQALMQDQKILREEVNQLKTQMGFVMEILNATLKKENSHVLASASEIPTLPTSLGSSLDHGVSRESSPQSEVLEPSHQQMLPACQKESQLERPKKKFDPSSMSYG